MLRYLEPEGCVPEVVVEVDAVVLTAVVAVASCCWWIQGGI